jgi:hypothetical protein
MSQNQSNEAKRSTDPENELKTKFMEEIKKTAFDFLSASHTEEEKQNFVNTWALNLAHRVDEKTLKNIYKELLGELANINNNHKTQ